MLKWLHHLFNPHCKDCLDERELGKICISCETLKTEVARLRSDNERLLDRLLEKPEPEVERVIAPEPRAPLPRPTGWRVQRQILEQESRERARILSTAPKASDTTEGLEKELLEAETARQQEGSK
jgi:hypothetical protein